MKRWPEWCDENGVVWTAKDAPRCLGCQGACEDVMVQDGAGQWWHPDCAEQDQSEGDRRVLAAMAARHRARTA